MTFPESYERNMKELLGENYPAYRDSFCSSMKHGFRINEHKISVPDFLKLWKSYMGYEPEPIPWVHNGFFAEDGMNLSSHPWYYAGLYYLQEPSAMTPAEILPVEPGDYILDLCAAPGGKSTELFAKLKGTGLLMANDISVSRAKALKKNLETFGADRVFVTAETPARLAEIYPGYFNKILIDAPCSGEGMFRAQPQMMSHWQEKGPEVYSAMQEEILKEAWKCLAPGGMILYSTCTFSKEEDELMVLKFMERHPDMKPCPIPVFEGFETLPCGRLEDGSVFAVRLYPHKVKGEGQFAALMKKDGEPLRRRPKASFEHVSGSEVYILPEGKYPEGGIHYLMTGIHKGTLKKGRLTLSQSYAMTLRKEDWPDCLDLKSDDRRVIRYLKGETLELTAEEARGGSKGEDTLVTVDGYPLGFGRRNKSMLKNRRNPGWRML